MSFGEFVFSVGFIQKDDKEDLFLKGNHGIPPRKQCRKTLEHSRRQPTEAESERLTSGASQPHLQAARPPGSTTQSPVAMSVHHRLLGCIYAVYSSRFDPRVQN